MREPMPVFKKTLIRNSIIIGVMVVLFGVFSYLFRLNIEHKVQSIKSLQARKVALTQSAQTLSTLIADWKVAKEYVSAVDGLVPHKDDLVQLGKDFEVLANSKGVVLDFTFGKEENPTNRNLGSIGFSATLHGSADQILNFFDALEEKYYAMKITSFDFVSADADTKFKVAMAGEVYFITGL